MVGKVRITVGELSSRAVKVGERTLMPTQSAEVDLDKPLTIEAVDVPEVEARPRGYQPDVFEHNNPNGIGRAEIGPKLAKATGELRTVQGKNGLLDVTVEGDQNLAIAAGGIEGAETGKTPGPAPKAPTTGVNAAAHATGVNDAKGNPLPLTKETVEKTSTAKSSKARSASTASVRKGGKRR